MKSLESGRIPEIYFFVAFAPFFSFFPGIRGIRGNLWNPWESVNSVESVNPYICKSANPHNSRNAKSEKNAQRNRETEFLRNYLSSYSRRHITLQHVRYELSVSVHHVHCKQKYAVHVSLWPNTVLNNTSLHIANSSGLRVLLCLRCTHTHTVLILYTTTSLHFTTSQYTTLQYTRRNETNPPLPSPASIASRTASSNADVGAQI